MAPLMSLAKGHEKVTFALITLFPILIFYSLICPILILFVPILLIGLMFHLFFFRDPDRDINSNPEIILAPADGTIYQIDDLKGIIRIRMSLFNVHVTRTPVSGTIVDISFQEGKHWPFISFIHRGSVENAHQRIHIKNSIGDFLVIQIVGFLARRCTTYLSINDQVQQGKRLGMIYYGSEVDIQFPPEKFKVLVEEKSKTIAGQTQLAKQKNKA